jgi:hypothetical protein
MNVANLSKGIYVVRIESWQTDYIEKNNFINQII